MQPGDTTDLVSPTALANARAKWGLDAAPTWGTQQAVAALPASLRDLKPEKRRRVKGIMEAMGTPGDVVRALMAKPVPPEWERELREISPITDRASYLVFAWKDPMDPEDPHRARWCLYEATPEVLVSTERLMELQSAPYWTLPTKNQRHGQAQIVSAYQWEMYRRHRVDVRPFWCLQGTEGGTPFHLDSIEQRYLRMMGLPDYPLPVGALPYAAWDGRTRQRVMERDRLYREGQAALSTPEREKAWRRRFFDWFSERMGPQSELMGWCEKHEDADKLYQRQTREEAMAADDARDVFIETGRLPDASDYKPRNTFSTS